MAICRSPIFLKALEAMKRQTVKSTIKSSLGKASRFIQRSLFFGINKSSYVPEPVFSKNPDEITPEYAQKFQSRFKGWIRTVALVIILVFVPEQISWAFNYNPAILWNRQKADAYVGDQSLETASENIYHILSQIEGKEKPKVKIILPNSGVSGAEKQQGLLVFLKQW